MVEARSLDPADTQEDQAMLNQSKARQFRGLVFAGLVITTSIVAAALGHAMQHVHAFV